MEAPASHIPQNIVPVSNKPVQADAAPVLAKTEASLCPAGGQSCVPDSTAYQPAPVAPAVAGLGTPSAGIVALADESKRKHADDGEEAPREAKKLRTEEPRVATTAETATESATDDASAPAPVPASKEGITFFSDNDVLSGRGGGTNVHPGNRNFRDLINLHRRAYLKARKNDKPAISRAIVRAIRENNGRFLKKDEKSGLWYEIGDDAAREKTSQALRQRAPEMRKLLFDTEREEARMAAEEQIRQQHMIMGMTPDMANPGIQNMMRGGGAGNMPAPQNQPNPGMPNPMLHPALLAMANKTPNMNNVPGLPIDAQMFSAALLGGGMNRFAPNNSN